MQNLGMEQGVVPLSCGGAAELSRGRVFVGPLLGLFWSICPIFPAEQAGKITLAPHLQGEE